MVGRLALVAESQCMAVLGSSFRKSIFSATSGFVRPQLSVEQRATFIARPALSWTQLKFNSILFLGTVLRKDIHYRASRQGAALPVLFRTQRLGKLGTRHETDQYDSAVCWITDDSKNRGQRGAPQIDRLQEAGLFL